MTEDDLKKIEGMLSFHFGAMSADFQKKIDLVAEGQQMLAERMDRMEGRMDRLENRVDGIAIDLAAHRRDTEAHRKGWQVREEDE